MQEVVRRRREDRSSQKDKLSEQMSTLEREQANIVLITREKSAWSVRLEAFESETRRAYKVDAFPFFSVWEKTGALCVCVCMRKKERARGRESES